MREGRWPEAEAAYLEAVKQAPGSFWAHHNLAITRLQTGKWEAAAASYRTAINLDPSIASSHENLGIVLLELESREEAIEAFRRALEIDPNSLPAASNLGNALLKLGRLEEAVVAYREALSLKRCPRDFINLGAALFNLEQYDEAIDAYQDAISIGGGNAEVFNNLGACLERTHRLEEAIVAYREVLALDPQDLDLCAYARIASVSVSIGGWLAVVEVAESGAEIFSPKVSDKPWLEAIGLATLYEARVQAAIALRDPDAVFRVSNLALALRLNREYEERFLGYLSEVGGRFEEAVSHFLRGIVLNPANVASYMALARALDAQGRTREAELVRQQASAAGIATPDTIGNWPA